MDLPWDKTWTFESSLGYKRQIDYILVSRSLVVGRNEASNNLDCGSDHRSVFASIHVPPMEKKMRNKKSPMDANFSI